MCGDVFLRSWSLPPDRFRIFCKKSAPFFVWMGCIKNCLAKITQSYQLLQEKNMVFFLNIYIYTYIYLEPKWPTYFWRSTFPKQGPNSTNQSKGAPPFGYSINVQNLHPTLRGAWSQCLHFWSFQQTLFTSSALMTQLQRQMRWEMALIHLEGGNFEDHRASHATIMALKVSFFGGGRWLSQRG